MPPSKMDIESIVSSQGNRSRLSWRVLWLVVLSASILGVWYWSSRAPEQSASIYTTELANISDISVIVTSTGSIEPTNVVEITSELSGTIKSVEADFNDPVVKGQILARLDTDKLEAILEQGKATLAAREARVAEAEVSYEEMRKQYERAIHLESTGAISIEQLAASQSAFQHATAALKVSEADVRVAKASLSLDEANLAKACICSSVDGVVLNRNVDVGQIVATAIQTPSLFTLAEDLRTMELHVDIDEADIGKVAVNNPANFTVEAFQGRTFTAAISEIRLSPQTIDGVVTYRAVLMIDNSDLLLLPGMTATVEIVVEDIKGALVVPNAALRFAPPVVSETEDEGNTGLLGMLFSRAPSFDSSVRNEPDALGRRTIWVLRGEEIVPVLVLTGSSDGLVTQIIEGDISPDDLIVVDMDREQ